MTYTSVYGALLSRDLLEQQILATLQTPPTGSAYPLIAYYLAEIERQRGLTPQSIPLPPSPDSYRGGLDFNTFQQEWAPQITVLAQPSGDAEREGAGYFVQMFEVQIGATVVGADEDSTRLLADRYGAAIMGIVAHWGGFGTRTDMDGSTVPFASRTLLMSTPRTELLATTERRVARSIVTAHTWLDNVATEGQGPRGPVAFPANPYLTAGTWPTITSVDIALQSRNPLGVPSAPTGVNVTDSTGHIIVSE